MPGGHQHNQLSHAGDLLDLAGRIELGDGETLISSGKFEPKQEIADVLWAVVDSPKGRQIRLGIIDTDGSTRWRAGNKGGTANLNVDQARTLRNELAQANELGKRHAKEADAIWKTGTPPTEPVLLGTEAVAEGRIHSEWGGIRYHVYVTDDDPTSWMTSIGVGDDETTDDAALRPAELKKFLDKLDELSGEAVRAEPQGGQFALGGGRVGAKPAQQKQQRKKAAPGSVLGYNPKTGQGTGYGSKSGDSRVRSLQEALNKLGLTDANGKPLKLDGKLGPKTTAAIKKLQEQLGMTPNGRVTPLFLSKITGAESVEKLKASIQKPAAKPAARAAFLQALSSLLLEDHIVRHPGHPNQKVHGRRGGGVRATLAAARNIAELNKALRDEVQRITGNRPYVALGAGGDVEIGRQHAEGVLRCLERFPKAKLTAVTGADFGAYARVIQSIPHDTANIQFSSLFTMRGGGREFYEKSLARSKAEWDGGGHGWGARGVDSPMAVAVHEFGHVLDIYTTNRAVHADVERMLERRAQAANVDVETLVRRELGDYAGTKTSELIAEAFADAFVGGDEANEISKEILSMLESAYRELP